MRPLSNSRGFKGSGEESGEAGDIKSPSESKQYYKDLIARANSVPIINIFKFYGLKISEQNSKIPCPFSHLHQDGRDSTASFKFYSETNSFWCFGCKTGIRCCDFVAAMDRCNKLLAANKILELYESDAMSGGTDFDYGINHSERLEILMEFSDFIREFIQNNISDSESILYVEKLSYSFDKMNQKHKLDNDALKSLVVKIKDKVSKYKSWPQ